MGRIQQQSIANTVITYSGMALGYVNTLLLFPNFFEEGQVGLAGLLVSISALFAQFAALGFPSVTLRFFPFFRTDDKQNHGYLTLFCLVALGGFLLFTGLAVLFKAQITLFFSSSPLLVEYFWYLLPLAFFTLYYNVLSSYLRSLHNTVVPSFFKDFLVRILVTLSIACYAFDLVDFKAFVVLFVVSNIIITIFLLLYVWRIGELRLSTRITMPTSVAFKALAVYGLFAVLANAGSLITGKLDGIILADLKGLYDVGIYITVFTLVNAIEIPSRSMHKIAAPQIAEFWAKNDIKGLQRLYKRTSLINLVIATVLFIGIWVNAHNIFALIPESYSAGIWIILIVGFGKLFDLMAGINGTILLTSSKYKWDIVFSLTLVGLIVGLDYALIPHYGINGAALGTLIGLVVFNSLRLTFVYIFYKIHPFDWRLLLVIAIGGISLLPGLFIPKMALLPDLLIRSSAVVIVYFGAVYLLKVSDDANRVGNDVLRRLGMRKR